MTDCNAKEIAGIMVRLVRALPDDAAVESLGKILQAIAEGQRYLGKREGIDDMVGAVLRAGGREP